MLTSKLSRLMYVFLSRADLLKGEIHLGTIGIPSKPLTSRSYCNALNKQELYGGENNIEVRMA